jgi:hypothetical protein
MNPRMPRGIRGIEDVTVEALVPWHQTCARGIGQRAHEPERPRRRPWVMKPHTAHPV